MKIVAMTSAALLACGLATAVAATPAHHVLEKLSGPDGRWDYISVDQTNHRLLMARSDAVTAFDISKPGAAGSVFATGVGGHAALAVNGGKNVLVTNGAANTVTLLDAAGKTAATIPTGANPDAAAIDTKSGLALVMDHGGGEVTLIDLTAMKKTGSIMIGGALEAAAVNGAGLAYVNVEDKNQVAVIDIAARKVLARYALSGCDEPTGIAYVAEGKRLIVACAEAVGVMSAETGKMIKTIKIGDGADGVAYDAARKTAYVPSGADGTLNVLSVTASDVVLTETVPTQRGARTLTVDPVSGKVYLPAATSVPAATAGARPTTKPGSFVVLVVGQ